MTMDGVLVRRHAWYLLVTIAFLVMFLISGGLKYKVCWTVVYLGRNLPTFLTTLAR